MPKVHRRDRAGGGLATVTPISQRRKSLQERSCGRSSSNPASHRRTSRASTAFAIANPRANAMPRPARRLATKNSAAPNPADGRAWRGARISMIVIRLVAGHQRATREGSGAWFRPYTDSTKAAAASSASSRPFARERSTAGLPREPSVKRPRGSPGSLCCTTSGQKHRPRGSNSPTGPAAAAGRAGPPQIWSRRVSSGAVVSGPGGTGLAPPRGVVRVCVRPVALGVRRPRRTGRRCPAFDVLAFDVRAAVARSGW